jgi:hypothetical protein
MTDIARLLRKLLRDTPGGRAIEKRYGPARGQS